MVTWPWTISEHGCTSTTHDLYEKKIWLGRVGLWVSSVVTNFIWTSATCHCWSANWKVDHWKKYCRQSAGPLPVCWPYINNYNAIICMVYVQRNSSLSQPLCEIFSISSPFTHTLQCHLVTDLHDMQCIGKGVPFSKNSDNLIDSTYKCWRNCLSKQATVDGQVGLR